MNKGVVLKRLSIVGVVFLFVASAAIPSTSRMNEISPLIDENDGTLSGYVTDTSMNPIEGALVQVYFHETYEEDYTDENGYYYVDNIPICYCLKNCTCSKEGYEPEWVLLGIVENTTYDFVLTSLDPVPDLECDGDFYVVDPEPSATIVGIFTVENIGDPLSELNWEIESYPDWGTWTFDPDSGTGLTPEGGWLTVIVEFILPDELEDDLVGEIKVVNIDNPDDFDTIPVFVKVKAVPIAKNINQQFTISQTLHQSINTLSLQIVKNI